jgi:transposase
MVRDPQTGKYRRVRLFVFTLGYSRKSVRLLTWRSSTQIWAELHERASRRIGGTVKVIVLDNLAEGVLAPDIYDPALNPLYRDVLAHYGVVALPCRVNDPDRNGYAERFVRSINEECLDRVIPFGDGHLRRTIAQYVEHYHRERNQGIENRLIAGAPATGILGRIRRRPRLGGFLNYYERAA